MIVHVHDHGSRSATVSETEEHPRRVLLSLSDHLLHHGFDGRSIEDFRTHASCAGDRFEILGAHDRAQAGPGCRSTPVVHHGGDPSQALAARTDDRHLQAPIAVLLPDHLLGDGGVLTPEVAGVFELRGAVSNKQVDRLLGLSFEEDQVIAARFEGVGEIAPAVRVAPVAGQGDLPMVAKRQVE